MSRRTPRNIVCWKAGGVLLKRTFATHSQKFRSATRRRDNLCRKNPEFPAFAFGASVELTNHTSTAGRAENPED